MLSLRGDQIRKYYSLGHHLGIHFCLNDVSRQKHHLAAVVASNQWLQQLWRRVWKTPHHLHFRQAKCASLHTAEIGTPPGFIGGNWHWQPLERFPCHVSVFTQE